MTPASKRNQAMKYAKIAEIENAQPTVHSGAQIGVKKLGKIFVHSSGQIGQAIRAILPNRLLLLLHQSRAYAQRSRSDFVNSGLHCEGW